MVSVAREAQFCGRIEILSVSSEMWGKIPHSRYQARAVELVKGSVSDDQKFSFVVPGGDWNENQIRVSGAPRFDRGVQYFVCFGRATGQPDYVVHSWSAMFVGVDQRTGKRFLKKMGESSSRSRGAYRGVQREASILPYDEVVAEIFANN